jgi:hypothetical protein
MATGNLLGFLKDLRLTREQFFFITHQAVFKVPLAKVLTRNDMLLGANIDDVKYVYRSVAATWSQTHDYRRNRDEGPRAVKKSSLRFVV